MPDNLERMKAIVAQAVAEALQLSNGTPAAVMQVRLDLYSGCAETETRALFTQVSRGTRLEDAQLVIRQVGSRFICWNCCGLRFEGTDGICPNCGDVALEIPDDIPFALRQVSTVPQCHE